MKDLVRYRAMESLCRQSAVFRPLESCGCSLKQRCGTTRRRTKSLPTTGDPAASSATPGGSLTTGAR
jgi:hypothetical protein